MFGLIVHLVGKVFKFVYQSMHPSLVRWGTQRLVLLGNEYHSLDGAAIFQGLDLESFQVVVGDPRFTNSQAAVHRIVVATVNLQNAPEAKGAKAEQG